MLRVLTLSTLFPNASQPVLGVFVERQTLGLAALPGVEVKVIAPIGLPPGPLARHPHYRARAKLPQRESWKGLDVHRPRFPAFPWVGARWNGDSMAHALLPALRDLRRDFPFDVIDAEFFWPDGPAAMRLARALNAPLSIKARGADVQYWGARRHFGPQIVAAAHAAGGLLSVSAALRDVMIGQGMPADRIDVHLTGVDSTLFFPRDRAAAKARFGIIGPLLVSVGALIPRKGFDLAIEAMRLIPEATLLIAGDGPERARLEALIETRGLASRVRLLGALPHLRLPDLFAAADVMVLPSSSEGLANVWVEALASGVPIVIPDVGGAREVVDRPEAGRLAAREPSAIAAAVTDLLASPPDPVTVRAASARFSWERNAAELRAHLTRVAEAGIGRALG